MQECQLFSVQGMPVLPILDARMNGFDWYVILEASGIRWTQCYGLKRPPRLISVLKFLDYFSSFVYGLLRSFLSLEH